MKALITLILSVIISLIFITTCTSQDRFMRGSYAVGGGIGYSQENDNSRDYTRNKWSIAIKPRISYFIFNYISCDVQLGAGHNEEEEEGYDSWYWEWNKFERVTSDLSAGLGFSYYLPLDNTYPFIRTGISYYYRYINNFNRKIDDEIILNASIGSAFFVSTSVAIEPELGYDYALWSSVDYKKNIFWLSFGIKYYVYEFGLE